MEAPDYEFKTVLTADELVEEKCVAVLNAKVFVLRVGNGWYLCLDTDNSLSAGLFCSEYFLDYDRILYYTDKWYWYDVKKGPVALGQRVHNLSFLWLDKTGTLDVLSWYADGALQQKMCKSCEVLSGYGIRELPLDLLKITTEDGEFFVSVRIRTLPNYSTPRFMGRKDVCTTRTETEVLFRRESFAGRVEFYKFAETSCEKLLKEGLGRVVDWYDNALQQNVYEENEEDYIVMYTAGVRHPTASDVVIYVNFSKLFRQEKGAYDVRCPELSYQRTADEIEFVHDEDERALLVEFGENVDKLYAQIAPLRYMPLCYTQI